MAITVNTQQSIRDVGTLTHDLMRIGVADEVLDVNMNQFALSRGEPVHSSGYATCIGLLVAAAGKGCLAHMDMNLPAFMSLDESKWIETNIDIYKRTISAMRAALGVAADLVLFASKYSYPRGSGDILRPLLDWALAEHEQQRLTGVWDFRTHPGRARTDQLGAVVNEGYREHYDRALYVPRSNTLHLFQSGGGGNANVANSWANLRSKLDRALERKMCPCYDMIPTNKFAIAKQRGLQVERGLDGKMRAADALPDN